MEMPGKVSVKVMGCHTFSYIVTGDNASVSKCLAK